MKMYTVVTLNKRGNFFPLSNPVHTSDRQKAFTEKRRRGLTLDADYRAIVIESNDLNEEGL